MAEKIKSIGIIGGGPAALFMFKRLLDQGDKNILITIFEKKKQLGSGMPYSDEGANDEHITNVSANEIPEIVTSIKEWIHTVPSKKLKHFEIDIKDFNEFRVLPRLLFGEYLEDQFKLLLKRSEDLGIRTEVQLGVKVIDIADIKVRSHVKVTCDNGETFLFDSVVICTGHNWPVRYEGKIEGYFDSPYPPAKLRLKLNHPVAIKGASLTAVDALRTLARENGFFSNDKSGHLTYTLKEGSENLKLMMYSRNGFLPAVRFHLEDSQLKNDSLLSQDELNMHRAGNNGFVSLDYIFEKDFKEQFKERDPDFYNRILPMSIEEFVHDMMELRENLDAFQLLKAEYLEAEKSIKRHESVYWKEMLAVLSFALNYPAKYFCAEDMMRLQKSLMPLISLVIAFIPQTSCRELMALHNAGVLTFTAVGEDSNEFIDQNGGVIFTYTSETGKEESKHFKTFINCIGQPHLEYKDFPFKSLLEDGTLSPAKLKFSNNQVGRDALQSGNERVEESRNGDYYLRVSGIAINDNFQVTDSYGAYNERIYIMAVPYIGGYNPDYSGLDFCEEASGRIITSIV